MVTYQDCVNSAAHSAPLVLLVRVTEYERWFRTRQTYPVNYELGFEPFVVASRLHLPWFDERLRGYSWDRTVHSLSLARSGLSLVVLPEAWLVHRPHPPSAAYSLTLEVAKLMRHQGEGAETGEEEEHAAQDGGSRLARTFARHVTLAKEALQEVEDGRYPAFGVSSLAGCRRLDLFFEGGGGAGAQELQAALNGLPREDKLPLLKQQLEQPVVAWW
ncbi:hypothetical protein H632_c3121p0 [Helicosporidium sp. ATCC 50920]|nr:hypothetical protein H632_c3121p0 [Helicosporidium sp. ATCC 50920]|eukprot:KDD72614.1 hypothetical protein H632_c3121p0 [Helicosporidium sp. ATCC 50920]